MGTTYLHAVASLDGYIADEHDGAGSAHLMLEDPELVIPGERVLHLRYPVRRAR